MQTKVTSDIRRAVERELRNYYRYRDELEELLTDAATASPPPPDGLPQGKGMHGDPTVNRLIGFHDMRYVKRLESICAAIERCLFSMAKEPETEEAKQRMVSMLYFHRTHTVEGVAQELGYSANTVWRWKRGLIEAVADELGYIVKS